MIPVAIISGAVLFVAGVVAALVLIISHNKHKTPTPGPTEAVLTPLPVTEAPSDTSAPIRTEPAPSPAASLTPTEEIMSTEPAPSSETAGEGPVRISEDLSAATFRIEIKDGHVKLCCLMEFVNNTDSVLYAASFDTGGLKPVIASCAGKSARFTVDENGLFFIPFMTELECGGSCSVYFELEGEFDPETGVRFPVFGYDTAYLISASVDSDVSLNARGIKLKLVSVDSMYHYSIVRQSAHSAALL